MFLKVWESSLATVQMDAIRSLFPYLNRLSGMLFISQRKEIPRFIFFFNAFVPVGWEMSLRTSNVKLKMCKVTGTH